MIFELEVNKYVSSFGILQIFLLNDYVYNFFILCNIKKDIWIFLKVKFVYDQLKDLKFIVMQIIFFYIMFLYKFIEVYIMVMYIYVKKNYFYKFLYFCIMVLILIFI